VSISLLNQTTELERLRGAVAAFADQHGLSGDVSHAASLALDEVVANVIRHGYIDGRQHTFFVRLGLSDGHLTIEVDDDARPFNPLTAPNPDLDLPIHERPIGGLGIHIVRTLMDSLEYHREDGRNRLTMIKNVNRFDAHTIA
jgi:anti-sigma regulatory factor (Ser/Thr protein kinase)